MLLKGSQSQLSFFVTVLIVSALLLEELKKTDLSEFHCYDWNFNRFDGDALGEQLMPEVL